MFKHHGRARRSLHVFLVVLATVVAVVGIDGTSASAAKKSAPHGTSFGAFTAQQWPVLFQVSADRKLIVKMAIVLDEKCSSGDTLSGIGSGDKAIVVSAKGAITDAFQGGPISLPSGRTVQYSDQINAKFNKARTVITGTWQETTTINDPTAGTTDTCDSGPISFKAVD